MDFLELTPVRFREMAGFSPSFHDDPINIFNFTRLLLIVKKGKIDYCQHESATMILNCCDAPVIVDSIQTRLDDFLGGPLKFQALTQFRLYPGLKENHESSERPKLHLDERNVITLASPFCPTCGLPLLKWGVNDRKLVLDHGHVPAIKGVQRYRCPIHEEIHVDLGAFVEPRKRYAENLRRRATQLVFDGATPPAVHRTLLRVYGVAPSVTSIRNWVYEAADAANIVLDAGLVPSSGYYGYDEIHLTMRDNRVFIQTAIDLEYSFVPRLGYALALNVDSTLRAWDAIHKNPNTKIEGFVLDGLLLYSTALATPRYAHVKDQLCHTHYKKNVVEKLYKAAGLGRRFTENLPSLFMAYKNLFFGPFNRSTRVNAEFSIARACLAFQDSENDDLRVIVRNLTRNADSLFRYLEYPRLQRTNNKNERFNLKLQRYPTLKTKMQTGLGIKRVAGTIAFLHNYDLFPKYIEDLRSRCKVLNGFWRSSAEDIETRREYMVGISHINQVLRWKAAHDKVFDKFFKIKPYPPQNKTTG